MSTPTTYTDAEKLALLDWILERGVTLTVDFTDPETGENAAIEFQTTMDGTLRELMNDRDWIDGEEYVGTRVAKPDDAPPRHGVNS